MDKYFGFPNRSYIQRYGPVNPRRQVQRGPCGCLACRANGGCGCSECGLCREHCVSRLTVTFPSQGGTYSGPTFIVTGTAPGNSPLSVCVNRSCSRVYACPDGQWSFPIDTCTLNAGSNTLTVSMPDCACRGERLQQIQFTYNPPALTAPAIVSPASGSAVTPPFAVSGTAAAGARVEVFGLDETYAAAASASGQWSVTVPGLETGVYSIYAVSTDACGRTSAPSNVVTIQFTAVVAAPLIVTPSNGGIYPEGSVLISGYAEPGAMVVVTVPDVLEGESVVADSSGYWSMLTPHLTGDNTFVIEAYQLMPAMRFSPVADSMFFVVSPLENLYIYGTVLSSATGFPIAGATVAVGNVSTTTDASGEYTLENLPGFPLDITASAPGYQSETNIEVIPTATGTESDFILPTGGPVNTGTLRVNVNEQDGAPAADAEVAIALIGETFQRQAVADAFGTAVFSVLPQGTYDIVATSASQDFLGSATATVTPGEVTTVTVTLDHLVAPGETNWIYGQVVSESADMQPIEGATVIADEEIATTDEQGHYLLTELPPDPVDVTASAPGYLSETNTDVFPTETGTQSNFELSELTPPANGATITVLNEDFNPAADARVILSAFDQSFSETGLTDANGHVAFYNVPPGAYAVLATSESGTAQGGVVIAISEDQLTSDTVTLDTAVGPDETNWIYGQVLDDETRLPVSSATVIADGRETGADTQGYYILAGLPGAALSAAAEAPGYETEVLENILPTEGGTPASFLLTPAVPQLVLTVLYENGSPAGEAGVILTQLDGNAQLSGTASAQGIVYLSDVPAGTYAAVATSATQAEQGTAVLDVGTQPMEAVLVLDIEAAPGYTNFVFGRVSDAETGMPIPDADVTADGNGAATGYEGYYVIAALPQAALDVTAAAAGYGTASNMDVLPDMLGTESNFGLIPAAAGQLGNIEVTVENQDGSPAAGALVALSKIGNPFQLTAITNAFGVAALDDVPIGIGALVATSEAQDLQGSAIVPIPPSGTAGATIVLDEETEGSANINWVFGEVIDADTGLPIEDAIVSANGISSATDERGIYVLNTLPALPLSFTASADPDEYESQTIGGITPTPSGVNVNFALSEIL